MKEHPVFARVYERISTLADRIGEREHRVELAGGASGRVMELGAGNGLNFEHYRDASVVMAVEPDPTMLSLAAGRARAAPIPVNLVRGAAEALPFQDGTFDTVVASLVLCSVRDPARAVGEIGRVLRRGGRLRFLEHVRSGSRGWARVQDVVAGPWSRVAGGCHPNRDTVAILRRGGFEVRSRGFPFGPHPCRPHMLGTAIRP